jgi:amino acid transporter
MADNGILPKVLGHRSKYGTPTYGIMMSAIGVVCLGWLSFSEIIQMLNILYCFAQIIEFAAFIQLRIYHSDIHRPYKIPLGTIGVIIMLLLPTSFAILMIAISSTWTIVVSVVAMLGGHLLYYLLNIAKERHWCEFNHNHNDSVSSGHGGYGSISTNIDKQYLQT